MERDTPPEWVDCLKHPVFGKAKEDVAPEAEEEKQQSVPEEAKAEPKPEKPKPTKKPASIPAKEIKIEAVNPVFLGCIGMNGKTQTRIYLFHNIRKSDGYLLTDTWTQRRIQNLKQSMRK
jgi:hypothetical protein